MTILEKLQRIQLELKAPKNPSTTVSVSTNTVQQKIS